MLALLLLVRVLVAFLRGVHGRGGGRVALLVSGRSVQELVRGLRRRYGWRLGVFKHRGGDLALQQGEVVHAVVLRLLRLLRLLALRGAPRGW